jgi:hypothetical protein
MGNFVTGVQLAASILMLYGMRSDGILSAVKCGSNFPFSCHLMHEEETTWCSNPPNYFKHCLQMETDYCKLWKITEKLPHLFWFE